MIWRGAIFLALGTAITASADQGIIARPELSMPRVASVPSEVRRKVENHIKASELEKLNTVVLSLGGKTEHAKSLMEAGREFQIDPIFLASLTFVESSFRATAASNKGARGMMQLRPIVLEVLGVTDPWDPHENIMAGAAYLRHCFDRYAKYNNSTFLALAAYNIGPGGVEKLTRSDAADRFVRKVLQIYRRFSNQPVSGGPRNPQPRPASARVS
ncbi:MAG: lytic transglycosylase domain-containing protein [Desulfomonile tiedjei]|uniref:Lytic transglycosylase domain-containing protein n=1 Tax=Desulfomonile tiedjei TaxID=2358 RepID=A0A9D6V0S8_9BACT|nr:lytic transglycosylase domain-containing protein [Desulfomonile tiedjei]